MTIGQFNQYLRELTASHPDWHYRLDIRNSDREVLVRIENADDFELGVITMEAFMEEYDGRLELTVNYLCHYGDSSLSLAERDAIETLAKELENDSH